MTWGKQVQKAREQHTSVKRMPVTPAIANRAWMSSACTYHCRATGSSPSPSGSNPKSPTNLQKSNCEQILTWPITTVTQTVILQQMSHPVCSLVMFELMMLMRIENSPYLQHGTTEYDELVLRFMRFPIHTQQEIFPEKLEEER